MKTIKDMQEKSLETDGRRNTYFLLFMYFMSFMLNRSVSMGSTV